MLLIDYFKAKSQLSIENKRKREEGRNKLQYTICKNCKYLYYPNRYGYECKFNLQTFHRKDCKAYKEMK